MSYPYLSNLIKTSDLRNLICWESNKFLSENFEQREWKYKISVIQSRLVYLFNHSKF